jgi:hypothetical protein
MSRLWLVLLLLFITNLSAAQDLKGTIKDKHSGNILIGVSIKVDSRSTYSDGYGKFIVSGIKLGDTLTFSSIGYHEVKYIVGNSNLDNLVIYLEQATILLAEVKINPLRNYQDDSLKFREEFALTFNYNKPKFKDIFITKNYSSNVPRHPNQANNSTASLISVDVLSVISLLGKKRNPPSKLQQKLIKEEEEQYLDNIFSKRMVQRLTGLIGDSLQTFMQLYRPNIDTAKYMSDYDIILHIKKSYHEYSEH